MIRKTNWKWMAGGLSAALIGVTLAGCSGQDNAGDTTAQTPPEAPAGQVKTAPAGEHSGGHDHDAEIRAAVGKFFPGATLEPKPLPMTDALAKHMGEEAGVKFTGKEKEWQVFEATQNGKRVGLAMMTHSALPDGKDMHIVFAVNPKFAVSHASSVDAPDNAKMQTIVKQLIGKSHGAAFKVGKDTKATSGVSPQVAQIAVDAVHKGVVMLDEFFNPAHSENEASHKEGGGHSHEGHGHGEGDGHQH